MNATEWGEVIVLVVCFFVAAAASGTETALTSVSRIQLRRLVAMLGRKGYPTELAVRVVTELVSSASSPDDHLA